MRGAVFDDLAARMGPDFDCLAPDLPGHGAAAGAAAGRPATIEACAEMVAAMLDGYPENAVTVVGWSMGAAVAWRYVAGFGTARLRGLVTVDMSPKLMPSRDWQHGLKCQTAETVAASTRRFAEDWTGAAPGIARTMFATPAGAPGFSCIDALRVILAQDADDMRALWGDLVALDQRDVIAEIDVPYLVCSGAQSRVYPAAVSDWIAATAPQARRRVFRRSGHSPHLEEAGAFAGMLSRFVASLDG
ncbi:alpha/beta fold hydrolase [Pukyongiella litopenaei]|uniref:Alpha/beta fold hydrolase n=2 Tax=Pukyongiella litopenaei TaxID=2605946 RepID=A0A2S0MUV0_9RHOB|nr:alpha/beta fold hydrolase [Pukyongiella litopenaei]